MGNPFISGNDRWGGLGTKCDFVRSRGEINRFKIAAIMAVFETRLGDCMRFGIGVSTDQTPEEVGQ
jgi:hypothetical protein